VPAIKSWKVIVWTIDCLFLGLTLRSIRMETSPRAFYIKNPQSVKEGRELNKGGFNRPDLKPEKL